MLADSRIRARAAVVHAEQQLWDAVVNTPLEDLPDTLRALREELERALKHQRALNPLYAKHK